jgi:hypothetical protein
MALHKTLQKVEADIIQRTIEFISGEDQQNGILIHRYIQDVNIINNTSDLFFLLVKDICREVGLAKMVPVIPSQAMHAKKQQIISEKIVPGVASLAITKQIDDTAKRARNILQRINILIHSINDKHGRGCYNKKIRMQTAIWAEKIKLYVQRFRKQQELFIDSMLKMVSICSEVNNERLNHITATEEKRNKLIYDEDKMFANEVIAREGKDEYAKLINNLKKEVFGATKVKDVDIDKLDKASKHTTILQTLYIKWQQTIDTTHFDIHNTLSNSNIKIWYHLSKCLKRQIKKILYTTQQVRQEEWSNSKTHLLRIGKYGQIARKTNPKTRNGPTTSIFYPSKPDQPLRRAINDTE